MTETTYYFYSEEGEHVATKGLTPERLIVVAAANPTWATGPAPTTYYIYVHGVYSHEWSRGNSDWLYAYLADNPGYTSSTTPYVPPPRTRWELEDLALEPDDYTQPYKLHEILRSQEDISHQFSGRNDPFHHSHFFKSEWNVERQDVPEFNPQYYQPQGAVRKVTLPAVDDVVPDPIYYECIDGHAGSTDKSPTGSSASTYWRVLKIWDSGFNISRGTTNCMTTPKQPRTVDPEAFRVDFEIEYTETSRQGVCLFAGSRTVDLARRDAGIDGGISVFFLLSQSGQIIVEMKAADNTWNLLGGSVSWQAFNGAYPGSTTSTYDNKKLVVPFNSSATINNKTKLLLTLVHHQGKILAKVDGVKMGTFTYDPANYPFQRAPTGHPATEGILVDPGGLIKYRGRKCGLMGSADRAGLNPSNIKIFNMIWSKLDSTDFVEMR